MEYRFKNKAYKKDVLIQNHRQASVLILEYIKDSGIKIDCIGHRFVHGGNHFPKSVFLDKNVLEKLILCLPLAPIHNPVALGVIYESNKVFPYLPQYVTFDSAFHSTIPYYAYTYALPKKLIKKVGFRKYGFHGLSYTYVAKMIPGFLKKSAQNLKIVACHLGTGGSSVVAIKNGRSVDTSMGYSPLSGLMMSTRCGDIDPMIMTYLMNAYGYRPDELLDILNKKSGILGISGFSSDITDILRRIYGKEDVERASLAFNMYTHRLKKYIGSYIAALGGIDALVFTDDIGIHNWSVREKVCENMKWAGIILDERMNRSISGNKISLISSNKSKVKIVIIPTEEDLAICFEGIKLLRHKK